MLQIQTRREIQRSGKLNLARHTRFLLIPANRWCGSLPESSICPDLACERRIHLQKRRNLEWHKAHQFVLAAYRLTRTFPRSETYGLSSQWRRAADSVLRQAGTWSKL